MNEQISNAPAKPVKLQSPKKARTKKARAKKAAPKKARKPAQPGPSAETMEAMRKHAAKARKHLKPLKEDRMTLRQELVSILKSKGEPMTTTELAARVAERKKFKKRDGKSEVSTLQVWTTAENAPDTFIRKGTLIRLKAEK